MTLAASEAEVFLVGDLRVDIGQQRITRDGIEVTLPNLSFQLLVALIRVAPNVVSHEALMEEVWHGIIVSPETLTKRVNYYAKPLAMTHRSPATSSGCAVGVINWLRQCLERRARPRLPKHRLRDPMSLNNRLRTLGQTL